MARPIAANGPIAVVDGVRRRFGDVTAVGDVSFTIDPGETVALLGPNGAGKTTTVEMLLGLTAPDHGTVQLFGEAPADAIAAGRVGAMLQDGGLPQGVTVSELVSLVAGLYPEPQTVAETLQAADLDVLAARQVQRLSGGQRQRVRLALALVGRPDLLVLDEPTAALDLDARREFWARARASVSEGRSLLFATHRLEEADTVADRAIVIAHGRVVADTTPDDIKAGVTAASRVSLSADGLALDALARLPGVVTVELLGERVVLHTADADATVRALLQTAPDARRLEVIRAGLEDAFLALTRQEEP